MLSALINEDDPDYPVSLVIEELLVGNGDKARKFRATPNLIDRLLELMDTNSDMPKTKHWASALHTLKHIKTRTLEEKLQYQAPKRYSSNPMAGELSDFPVVSALLESPSPRVKEQFNSLCILLIYYLIESANPRGSTQYADNIRFISNKNPDYIAVLARFPIFSSDIVTYSISVIEAIESISRDFPNDDIQKILPTIKRLASKSLKEAELRPASHQSQTPPTKFKKTHTLLNIEDTDDKPSRIPGNIIVYPSITTANEYPDNNLIWTEESTEDEEPLPLESLIAGARTSRFWIRQHQNITQYDKSHFSGIERRKLTNFILEGMKSKKPEELCPALLISLAYLTPLSLKEVLSLTGSPSQDLLNHDGMIIRAIPLPENRYKPPTEAINQLQPTTDEIILPLYKPIQTVVRHLLKDSSNTILDGLKVSADVANNLIDSALGKIRENGRYRITQKRIDSAFRLELALKNSNALITHILASSANQASPTLAYYAAVSTNQLLSAYHGTIAEMMRS